MEYNYYKKKLRILEAFYMGIDQGYNYTVAVGQCLEYNRPQNDLDAVIIPFTFATRFARCDREISEGFREKLWETIKKRSYLT